jgi:hypothetical protein
MPPLQNVTLGTILFYQVHLNVQFPDYRLLLLQKLLMSHFSLTFSWNGLQRCLIFGTSAFSTVEQLQLSRAQPSGAERTCKARWQHFFVQYGGSSDGRRNTSTHWNKLFIPRVIGPQLSFSRTSMQSLHWQVGTLTSQTITAIHLRTYVWQHCHLTCYR